MGANTAGLAGVVVGESAICTVGVAGKGLNYRGYSIESLSEEAEFEEVAYLLIYEKLPNHVELFEFTERLKKKQALPKTLCAILELIPSQTHPMDVLRTACSVLGNLEPETNENTQHEITERLLATVPGMLLYWYHFHINQKRIETMTESGRISAHFLNMLHQKTPDQLILRAMDVSLILYAEHEYNASTFSARVCASTESDFYSSIVSAIGTLRGPLHGGANEAAMKFIQKFKAKEEVVRALTESLERKEKIMGFGHRVYKKYDPRSPIIKKWAKKLSELTKDSVLYPVSEAIEDVMWKEKKLFPNLDFYSAAMYHFCGIPTEFFTPIFVMSRITGWAAHIFEQRSNNRLIRPVADYIGPSERAFIKINDRI